MLDVKLAAEHTIATTWEGGCCYGSEVQCQCDWRGAPMDFTTHFMLVVAGVESEQIINWRSLFPGGDIEAYLDIYRPPNEVKARKSAETKARNAARKQEKLVRMAVNGDKKAQEELASNA